MASHSHAQQFPRAILVAAAALIGLTIALAALGRLSGLGVTAPDDADIVASIELYFQDREDGSVWIYRDVAEEPVTVLPPGTNGFVRGVMRGLARERRMHDVGAGEPFELRSNAAGGLRLHDPSTRRTIDLQAFGPDNYGAFAAIYSDATAASDLLR